MSKLMLNVSSEPVLFNDSVKSVKKNIININFLNIKK